LRDWSSGLKGSDIMWGYKRIYEIWETAYRLPCGS
jgi:hypothetical protein